MFLARIEGSLVATRKHESLVGWRLMICQPLNASGNAEGTPIVAIDPCGAGMHQQVIVSSDGAASRNAVGDQRSPVRMMIIGIVDESVEELTT
ncbi:MAG: Ethanolamine utilization protein EutN [Verrucomicrobia subdivision 3 bacterium]|nr:Ethanolamine utilization protein EutN [Limisphaerales bacterium]MCS1414018.1 Ethanolamine utilization protein EutN [Limisphaerales bacterium]